MYFVMLDHPSGAIVPLTTEDNEVAIFANVRDARIAAMREPLGVQFGYEIFEVGTGV